MILNDKQIKEAIDKQEIVLSPFDKKLLEPASYDLRVGAAGISTTDKERRNIKESDFISIGAGDFALVLTEEIIKLDLQHTARFGLRSKYARDGLVATVGAQVDPGFHGRLKVGLVNMSTKAISLGHLDHFLTIEFHHLQQSASRGYDGEYQDQLALTSQDFEQIVAHGQHAFSEAFENLRELVISVSALSNEVKHMASRIDGNRNNTSMWIGIVVGAIGLTAALIFGLSS